MAEEKQTEATADLELALGYRAELVLDAYGTRAVIGYRPGAYTDAVEDEYFAGASINAMLLKLVSDWTYRLNGEPVPVSEDGLKLLPLPLKKLILTKIAESLLPN